MNEKIDRIQRISSYISGCGLKVYEIEQYNKSVDTWYTVGNSSQCKDWIVSQIQHHNYSLALKNYIEQA